MQSSEIQASQIILQYKHVHSKVPCAASTLAPMCVSSFFPKHLHRVGNHGPQAAVQQSGPVGNTG